VLALLAVLGAGDALAHATQLSSARLQITGNAVSGVLELNGRDLEVALRTTLLDPSGQVSETKLRAARAALDAYVLARARVLHAAGGACRGSAGGARPENDHVLIDLAWRCPPVRGALVYESTLFHEVDPAARHVVTAGGDVRRMGLLSVSTARLTLAQTRTDVLEVLRHYLVAGVEHIGLGYDHIAFLLAVIAWARRLWPLIGVITAFTLAHSVTLTLTVLDLVTPPVQLVELLIALSVVYVAAENFFVRDLRRRWLVTFAFGLVHGFGFASVLRDYGLPDDALLPALAGFNLGVEAGQLAVVLVAFGALHGLLRSLSIKARERVQAASPLAVSVVVLVLGLYWTMGRLMQMY
jgi:hypothetical protein